MSRHLVTVILLLSVALVLGCTASVMDYNRLVKELGKSGATVEPIGNTPFPGNNPQYSIFSGTAKRIRVNGEDIALLEYDDNTVMESETKFISSDGFTYKSERMTANISWIAPPHFYKAGRIIVLYIGENQGIIGLLENLLGPQFAGG